MNAKKFLQKYNMFDIIKLRLKMIIDIEGTDGSGKQTQTRLLYDYLTKMGKKCKLIAFPNYQSESSAPVKMFLSGTFGDVNSLNGYQVSSLYAIDRMLTMKQINIADYDYIIFDRYTPSNMIHNSRGLKSKADLDAFLNWVADFEYNKLKLPKPDKIIFLDVPIEFTLQNMANRASDGQRMAKDVFEHEDVQREAYSRAKYAASKMNWKTIRCVQNGAMLPKEIIHEKIKRILNNDY